MAAEKGKTNVSNESSQLEPIEIVISGLSGRFPESSNVEEFAENLFGGVDMITDDARRWTPGVLGLPTRSGKLKELDKFDADYFSVHAKQADFMDPQLRMLLEVTQEAIMDAGVNPQEIRGQNVGVFIGAGASESEFEWINDTSTTHGYALTGCQRTMLSNRISFAFDFKGPSFTVDTACSSSLMALQQAHVALRFGLCDAAIVGGVSLCLNPKSSFQFHKLNMLSPQGKCQSFDASGDGYVRSEAVVAIFLQRKNVARRYYASILAVKTNTDGHKAQGVTFPSGEMQKHLLEETYKEARVDPRDVVYIEAHGTGTPAGDPQELNAIADVFCKDRNPEKPLLIGSVKSNMGHSEPASGLCGVTKVLLAMQRGMIPRNLHYTTPNSNIPALKSGQVKVVAENMKWNGGIVGINSIGFGGANVHLILESNPKRCFEDHDEISMKLPYLIPFSGLSKDSVELALKEISSRKIDRAQLRLLYEIHSTNIPRHQFRGFAVVPENGTETEIYVNKIKPTTQSESTSPQVWFIFNGMGSQRAGIGKSLMKFQTCKESLEKSAAILKTKNLDLLAMLMDHPESSFESNLYSSISVAAVQIALVDLFSSLNIKPDGIIGYSIGELCAAYADGCMTAEQVILTCYAACQSILDMGPADGAMVVVGLSWEQALKKCPQGIYPACHNSENSVTVSGPAKLMNDFVEQLQKDRIFAKKVNSGNQAFHSKHLEPVRQKFQGYLRKIIPASAPRSSRWISSSIPESQWNSDLAKTSSADYHVNNLISPVLFKEAVENIRSSSSSSSSLVVIEIGPRAPLQPILKQSLPNCSHIGLFSKNHKDHSVSLCKSIGEMFNFGLNPSLSVLYPEIQSQFQLPVPLSTGSLSSLVSKCWDHSKSWKVASPSGSLNSTLDSTIIERKDSDGFNFEISLDNEEDEFYAGHQIDGRILFPQSGLIVLAWKSWAGIQGASYEKVPFVIENLVVSRATLIPKKGEPPLKFHINTTKNTGEFRIQESGILVASGTIRSPLPSSDDFISVDPISIPIPIPVVGENGQEIVLNQQDFYKLVRLGGAQYSGVFQGIKRVSFGGGWAELEFSNWVAFIDVFLHPLVGSYGETKSLLLPARLKKLVVDPQKVLENLNPSTQDLESKALTIPTLYYPNIQLLSCAGMQMQGQKLEAAPRNQQLRALPQMEKFEFTPYFDDPHLNPSSNGGNVDDQCVQTCIGIVLENLTEEDLDLRILEVAQTSEKLISPLAKKFCESQPKRICDVIATVSDLDQHESDETALKNSGIALTHVDSSSNVGKILSEMSYNRNLVILHELESVKEIAQNLEIGTFVLLRLPNSSDAHHEIQTIELTNISNKISNHFSFYLFRKWSERMPFHNHSPNKAIEISTPLTPDLDFNYQWVENLKVKMKIATKDKIDQGFRINVISRAFSSEDQFLPSGIMGLINSLRREPGGQALRCFFTNDPDSPVLDFEYPDQELQTIMQRDLLMNVYQNGKWGSFRFFPLQPQTNTQVKQAYLNFQKRGDLSSFQWFQSPLKYSEENLCSVYYSALNFRDVMLASGKLHPGSLPNNLGNQDCILGMEFSGLDSKGKRVMGILPAKAMATCVAPDPGFLWEVPSSWSLADAATVPVAYATAYYALIVRGGLEDGESVLIHGGAGAVGLAAISIALSKNCRVFATVGSTEKREFLKTTFPKLNDSCLANSRDASFLQHVMTKTKGRGVDLVLNSLAGDKLMASIECVAQHGRFLELGKVDLFNDTKLGMSILLKNVSVSGILLDALTNEISVKHKIWKLTEGGIETGVVRPLNYTVFSDSTEEVENAFRFMASGKHIGKILIQIRNEQETPNEKIIAALPRSYFDPSKSYIILGGLGGFGLELCGWMIERGATKLMLVSRSGVTTGYQKLCLSRWKTLDAVSVVVSTKDSTTFEGATDILNTAIENFNGGQIGGIFNLAMVLRDGLVENQTPENFEAVAKPKINASMAMDKASRALAPELEYFVCFSSIVSGRGAPGLSNYAYANSALERICEMRKSGGFPGLAIQWGAIGDVGVMVDKFKLKDDDSMDGIAPQGISSCLNTLDIFLHSSLPSAADDRCSTFASFVLASKSKAEDPLSQTNWMESIARILGLKEEELEKNPEEPFYSFGMDSLMGAEIQQVVEVTSGRTLSAPDFLTLSLSKLREIMPSAKNDQDSTDHQIQKPEQETIESKRIENVSLVNKSQAESDEALPVTLNQHDLYNYSAFNEPQAKPTPSSTTTFKTLQWLIAYFFSMILLFFIYLILIPISSLIRFFAQISVNLFQDSSRIKLVLGSCESMFIIENTNLVNILKFGGVPKKEEILKILQTRLFKRQNNFKVDTKSNSDTAAEDFYEPSEKLKWTIETGFWFCYWKKDENFDVARHVVFEQVETSDLDSEMPRLAKYYHNLKWDVQENSSSSWSSRPWWEMRIVTSEKAKEFLVVFVSNHAYGDGRSTVRLFQQAYLDVPPPGSFSVLLAKHVENEKSTFSSSGTSISNEPLEFSMFEELNHILAKIKQTVRHAHLLTGSVADLILKSWDTRKDSFFIKQEPHAASSFGKFPLSLLKSVKDPDTGKFFNLNAVVLTICARVYRRIAQESTTITGVKCPTQLLPYVTWSPFENSHSNLANDSVITPVQIPLTFESFGEEGNDVKNMLQTLKITQKDLAATGEMEKLLVVRQFVQQGSALPLPFLRALSGPSLKCSFVYSNVLAIIPKTTQFLHGHKLKDIYGFAPASPIILIAITDSVNDSLSMTLTVGASILSRISPEFHHLFFPYFEQEMKLLENF